KPGTVTDLAVTEVTDSSATLAFTEVSDGTGRPASYDVRWAVGTITWSAAAGVTQGSCSTPVAGSALGAKRSCTVQGLTASTSYQFQLAAFRGTLNVNAVFGALSNVAAGSTPVDPPPTTGPVASVTVSPASVSVGVGGTQQLTATLKDSAGGLLSGRLVTWTTSNAAVATVSGSGVVSGVVTGTATLTATSEGASDSSALTVTATKPGTVTDLAMTGATDSSATLAFTEVSDGTGRPASYDVRWAVGTMTWNVAASVTQGSCTTPLVGSALGAKRSCTVLGPTAATGYQFELVAFRGTLNV